MFSSFSNSVRFAMAKPQDNRKSKKEIGKWDKFPQSRRPEWGGREPLIKGGEHLLNKNSLTEGNLSKYPRLFAVNGSG
jgi:hypothetical protein